MSPIVDFSAGYQPPGVYIETESTGSVAAVGVGATVLCLVGRGIGYETNTENISFADTNSVVLAKKFVTNDATLVVSAVMDDGKQVFVIDGVSTPHDYSVSTVSNVTTITRHTSGQIPVDRVVSISYRYADDDYYALNKFDDYQTLSAIYGQPLDPSTGAIASEISFAAQVAFRNDANVIYAVSLDLRAAVDPDAPTSTEIQDAWTVAYNKLLPNYEINLVIPLWSDVVDTASATTYLSDLTTFLGTAETEGFPLVALAGVSADYVTNDPDTLSASVADRRVVLVWPQRLLYFNSQQNKGTTECDGFYLAAACAGVLADQPLNRGLTRSQISGFTGIPSDLLGIATTSKKNTWSSKGVSVAEINRTNQLIIRHGVTTDIGSIGDREISIVRCQDAILESLQLTLEGADLIGDAITPNTPLMVSSLVDGALQGLLADNVLANYTPPLTQQAPGPDNNPTVIQVTFSYQPTYPLNYIAVTFTLDLTTATITSSTDTTTSV